MEELGSDELLLFSIQRYDFGWGSDKLINSLVNKILDKIVPVINCDKNV